ncbi:MAG: hypothetical protein AB7O80_09755 [Acetobacteraceae bacterium]
MRRLREVLAMEFALVIGRCREMTLRKPVAVTKHVHALVCCISAFQFDEMQRLKTYVYRTRAVTGRAVKRLNRWHPVAWG